MTTPTGASTVPDLTTPVEVADWLDAAHPYDENLAAFARITDLMDGDEHAAMRLWHDGVQLVAGQRHGLEGRPPCPRCSRVVSRLADGQYEAHEVPGLYDLPCHEGRP